MAHQAAQQQDVEDTAKSRLVRGSKRYRAAREGLHAGKT